VRGAEAHRNKGAGETVGDFLLFRPNVVATAVEPVPPPVGPRRLFQRANLLRFAVALDAYLRVDSQDASDPTARVW
jgi:hypothetical protein